MTNQEGSVLLCCEDVLSLEFITPEDGLEEMEDEATLTSSTVDINQTTCVLTKLLVISKDDIIKYFPEILEGLGSFLVNHTTLMWTLVYHLNACQPGQYLFTNKLHLSNNWMT